MHANSPGAFSLSVTVHALVVGIAVAATFFVAKHREIKPLDFEMVDDKDIEIGDHFEMPGPPSPKPVKFKPSKVKLLPVPKPLPEAPPETKPESGKNPPAPVAKPPPKKGTTSYAQWQAQNKKQLEQNQKSTADRRTRPAPGIDAKGMIDDLQKFARGPRGDGGGTGGTKLMIAALDAYWSRLIRALKAAYEQPDNVSELLTARVSFFLASDGSISAVRVIKSSGDPAYDQSVVDAFHQVRSIGAVPGGKSGTFEINFKMTE